MGHTKSDLSRRDFLKGAATATVAGALAGAGLADPLFAEGSTETTARRAKVVLVRHERVLDESGRPNDGILQSMLDQAVSALVGREEPSAAWRQLIRPEDTVGIKSNVWRFLGTPPGLEAYIRRRVIDAGVSAERVAVGDRDVLHDTVFQNSTALINVRPMRTHHWAGVGSLIKNYIMFSPDPPSWHGDSCANLAGLWDLPIVKGKTRLNVLVLLTPLFQSKGPHGFDKQYTWPYRGLLVGLDPVATDATGLRILRAKRRAFFGRDEPFEISPKHIEVAESKYRLGIADAARIDVVKLGWQDESLL
jgi:hypothetical protein